MMIIVDSIKDPLILQVSYKKTPKKMYDAFSRMYEGRNINKNMNLRAQLKGTKMRRGESIQDYFRRVSQFKEQLSSIGDTIYEDELVMNALNGLTRNWNSFIQTLCGRNDSMNFDIVWEDCSQEEARVANREALPREDDQALAIHTKERKQLKFNKGNHKPFKKKFQKKKKDYSKYQCYNCHKIGHLARECPSPKKKNNNKRHNAHLAEDADEEEIPQKRLTKEEDVEEYVLFSAPSGSVTPGKIHGLLIVVLQST